MKPTIQKASSMLFFLLIAFAACEREEDIGETNAEQTNRVMCAAKDSVPNAQQWNLFVKRRTQTLSKGYYIDLSLLGKVFEFDSCKYKKDTTVRYQVMKINRRNSNKYFYIMMENLDVQLDTGCCAYNNSETNAAKYGRLYSWYAANAAAQDFTMKLPIYKVNDTIPGFTVKGRLPNVEDIYDLLEVDSLGYNADNGFSIDDCYDQGLIDDTKHMYYDMLLFGMEDAEANDSIAFPCLGGTYDPNFSIPFYSLNEIGWFWTAETGLGLDRFKPLRIDYQNGHIHPQYYNFVASAYFNVNVAVYGNCRFSVRYVFEPKYVGL